MQGGLDVRLVQLGLSAYDMDVIADSVFGTASQKAVRQFQRAQELAATGVVDAELIVSPTDCTGSAAPAAERCRAQACCCDCC